MPASPPPNARDAPAKKHAVTVTTKSKAALDKQAAMKGADFGKAIGIDRPANVRDKIRKWQVDLADDSGPDSAAASPHDSDAAAAPKAAPAATPKSAPPTPRVRPVDGNTTPKRARTPTASADMTSPQPTSAARPTHNILDEEVHTATAPKKRVVSDSHWRNKKSPPKDSAGKPSPKPLPRGWVRPAARKSGSSENKASAPNKLDPKSPIAITPKNTPPPRSRSARRRRPSRPTSSGVDARPTSSGSASAKEGKVKGDAAVEPASPTARPEKEKYELLRVRRRPKSETSPRSSLSADEQPLAARRKSVVLSGPLKREDPMNQIVVEYEPSHVEPARERSPEERRRRRRRRGSEEISPEGSPKEPTSAHRRRTHRRSHQQDSEDDRPTRSAEPVVPSTPPKPLGSRLEQWLSMTPDPFVEKESQRRRTSKETVSTLELSQKDVQSEVTASTDVHDAPLEDDSGRRSSDKRRRRRRKSPTISVNTRDLDDEPSTVVSSELSESRVTADDRDATPSPTLTLKRRGARRSQHSPTKDRAVTLPIREHASMDTDDASSVRSSSVDPTSVDLEKVVPRSKPDLVAMRRMFPSTGKRLSTIASVETFNTRIKPPSSIAEESETTSRTEDPEKFDPVTASEMSDQFASEVLTVVSRKSTRRKKLASHADLMSVLSMPKTGSRSIISARSIRTNRSRLATATLPEIMDELASDETKYMRELRTLVDGVIPVLLSCVLSKSDSAVAAGLFSRASKTDPSKVTKPIVDMGVCLERLKTLHRRVPKDNAEAFLSWAQSAQRVYADYLDAWRLGFEDVVVSLAPADEDPFTPAKVVQGPDDAAPWDEGLPRNAEGYVVNGDGERVDVAYMLKRPLVRLKYLTKTMKGINHVKPTEQAEKMSVVFQELVTTARKRSNEERARLEDVAAANIDPTRARDPRSLAPLAGVRIDPALCVRARDYFDMHLLHSSGQEVNCRVELLLRDNAPGAGPGGDLLLCEADASGRWLFFPPMQQTRISARNGDSKGEIVVMIRGFQGDGAEWSEVFSLRSEDEQAGFEWVHMLGLQPVPPQISELKRELSIIKTPPRPTSSHASSSLVSAATASTLPQKSRTPSPHEIEIPIGEQAKSTSKKWGHDTPDRRHKSRSVSPITPPSSDVSRPNRKSGTDAVSPLSTTEERRDLGEMVRATPQRQASRSLDSLDERTPRSLDDAMRMSGSSSPSNLRRAKATKRLSKNPVTSPDTSTRPSRQIILDDPEEEVTRPRKLSKRRSHKPPESIVSQSSKGFSVWLPSASEAEYSDDSTDDDSYVEDRKSPPRRPSNHRRVSSAPSMDLPTIPKIRKTSQPTTPSKSSSPIDPEEIPEPPASAPPKLAKRRSEPIKERPFELDDEDEDSPPPVPPHRSPSPATPHSEPSSPVTIKGSGTPVFAPNFKNKRRSSSPLKHEYEPSTASETSSESEEEFSSEEESITSESTDDELDDDVPMPLMPIGQAKQFPKVSPPSSVFTNNKSTITPSQSASQSPYRTVPQSTNQVGRSIVSIFTWSDAGRWDSLHPDECSIVVTPGKIEILERTVAHAAEGEEIYHPNGKAPLLAVELTPLVPMRKSTAIDITIRSPPTAHSRINSGNNIMLRSRSPAECAQLYAMINQSRINNPTYIALQNARGPYGQSSWAEAMDRQNAARTSAANSGGWFSGSLGRRSSYRKSSTRAASISAVTESSVGTMNTALRSALGRFSLGKNGRFNIRNSTLGSRSTGQTFDIESSNSAGSSPGSPVLEPGRAPGAPPGIMNSKCRLYERDTFSSKWRDMGSARLTIMLPDPTVPYSPMRHGKGSPGARDPTQEKRIVVVGKSKGDVLLDATLGESCFERVARSGIAVSVWEDNIGEDGVVGRAGKVGGVSGARARVFMVQMKSERECAYGFSLLGKLRY